MEGIKEFVRKVDKEGMEGGIFFRGRALVCRRGREGFLSIIFEYLSNGFWVFGGCRSGIGERNDGYMEYVG